MSEQFFISQFYFSDDGSNNKKNFLIIFFSFLMIFTQKFSLIECAYWNNCNANYLIASCVWYSLSLITEYLLINFQFHPIIFLRLPLHLTSRRSQCDFNMRTHHDRSSSIDTFSFFFVRK